MLYFLPSSLSVMQKTALYAIIPSIHMRSRDTLSATAYVVDIHLVVEHNTSVLPVPVEDADAQLLTQAYIYFYYLLIINFCNI